MNVPGTFAVASNCVALSGVPYVMDAGAVQARPGFWLPVPVPDRLTV